MQTRILREPFVPIQTYDMDVPERVGQVQELRQVHLVLTALVSCY
jgi:hypothetical protein